MSVWGSTFTHTHRPNCCASLAQTANVGYVSDNVSDSRLNTPILEYLQEMFYLRSISGILELL